MLDKKQIPSDFLFEQRNIKAAETIHISNAFGPRTNGCIMQWWFKTCKGDKGLEDENDSGHWKLTRTNWNHHWSLIILQLYKKLPQKLNINHSIQHFEANWKGGKASRDDWRKKGYHFEVSSSLMLCKNQWTISPLACDLWWNVVSQKQWWPAQWLDQEKAQSTSHGRKFALPFGGLLSDLIHYNFRNAMKPLQLRSMPSKSIRCP